MPAGEHVAQRFLILGIVEARLVRKMLIIILTQGKRFVGCFNHVIRVCFM